VLTALKFKADEEGNDARSVKHLGTKCQQKNERFYGLSEIKLPQQRSSVQRAIQSSPLTNFTKVRDINTDSQANAKSVMPSSTATAEKERKCYHSTRIQQQRLYALSAILSSMYLNLE
jgi:hypothetical protein